jgi:hypothetical protein
MAIKPILFNTEMVRAILDGRKCCTRRVVKFPVNRYTNNVPLADKVVLQELRCDKANFLEEPFFSFGMNLPYQPGDILYVRETFGYPISLNSDRQYVYRADEVAENGFKNDSHIWHPSIHMSKEAARIWLKVTDVKVERLQEITEVQAQAEGCNSGLLTGACTARGQFEDLWNSTIKKSDLDRYGWDASPWVWVIEFERCEKPEGEN